MILTLNALPSLVAVCKQALPTLPYINKTNTGSGSATRHRGATIGNIATIFIAFAEKEKYNHILKCGACGLLVDILKESGDKHPTVRKNAAVALAKLLRDEKCGEQIRALRGMEILLQLGKQLV